MILLLNILAPRREAFWRTRPAAAYSWRWNYFSWGGVQLSPTFPRRCLFLHSTPAIFLSYFCDGYKDASLERRSSFLCITTIFVLGPAAFLLSAPILLNKHVGAQAINVRRSSEINGLPLPQIELPKMFILQSSTFQCLHPKLLNISCLDHGSFS